MNQDRGQEIAGEINTHQTREEIASDPDRGQGDDYFSQQPFPGDGDIYTRYRREALNHRLLTHEEEKKLGRQIMNGRINQALKDLAGHGLTFEEYTSQEQVPPDLPTGTTNLLDDPSLREEILTITSLS